MYLLEGILNSSFVGTLEMRAPPKAPELSLCSVISKSLGALPNAVIRLSIVLTTTGPDGVSKIEPGPYE
jgi:hypothetical protein